MCERITEKYIVIADKGVVVCVMEDVYLGLKAKAKAKCDARDTFDEKIGRSIAGRRAQIKLFKLRKQYLMQDVNMYKEGLKLAQIEVDREDRKIKKISASLAEFLEETK